MGGRCRCQKGIEIGGAGTKECMLSRFSHGRFFATPRTGSPQVPLSMGFPSQESWSGLPFPAPGDLSYQGLNPDGSVVKNLPANARDTGLIPGLGRSPAEGNGNPLQYFCLENPMEGGAWPGGHKRVGFSDLGQLSD